MVVKRIVVASGKGGTGKTTITGALARLAAGDTAIAMADADVEASNLPIALNARVGECAEFDGRAVARIEPDVCSGCSLCEQVCRFAAPAFDFESGLFVIDPWACEGCGSCVRSCPTGAARLVQTVAGSVCDGETDIGPMAFGQLEPGEDQSGRLVSDVRALAESAAASGEAEVLFIDGPPGIGCPATAAISDSDLLLAVTEPSISGAHDLERLIELARQLGVEVRVVLNKADLSEDGARSIRRLCETNRLPLLAEIPFDRELAVLHESAGWNAPRPGTSPAWDAIARVWNAVRPSS